MTNEDNKPHLCVPTLDGNAHVIPTEVFEKIVSGEMKITDMEDWEIITRTAFSEWLRGLETAAKARVYKSAVDELGRNIEEEHEAIYNDWVNKCEIMATQLAKIQEAHKIIEDAARVLHGIFVDEDRGLLGPEALILQKINDWLKANSN